MIMKRRNFIKNTSLAALGVGSVISAPEILTASRVKKTSEKGELVFMPEFVQAGLGPHLLDWAYAADKNWDAFYSNISASKDGVKISDTEGQDKFSVEVRWNVEGFGYIFISADNGGEYYSLPAAGKSVQLNLNYELAKSRVLRNQRRTGQLMKSSWQPSREVQALQDLSKAYFEDAGKTTDQKKSGAYSQKALFHAMWAGEKMELDHAEFLINKRGFRENFFIGCDARGFFQMDPDIFFERFTPTFNYATITHYLVSGSYQDFEPEEGKKQFQPRTVLFNELKKRDITVEGRPLFWFYRTTTPDWLRNKSFDQLLKYVESHTREVVGHYGDGMYAWEVMNEAHDWANELQLTPEQIVRVAKLACDVARDTNPKVHRLINNCCPFAEYVQLKKWGELDAKYPQRTPHKFLKDLVAAGVDFTITGQQMYFPYRDLSDTILLVERLEEFGRPVQLTEVGASSGPTKDSVNTGWLDFSEEPYIWHRPWDQELQADWLEGLYTLAYSKPWIEAVNWYDFADPNSFIKTGGLLSSSKGEPKAAYQRLEKLQKKWKSLPEKK